MYHNETERRSKVASIDLDTALFHAVDLIANVDQKVGIAGAGGGYGILVNKPKAGEDASIVVDGECEVRVGAAVQAGDYATSAASGWLTKFNTASTQVASGGVFKPVVVLGRFITGAASGMLAALEVDPYLTSVQSI
jgi:hypothetical protein